MKLAPAVALLTSVAASAAYAGSCVPALSPACAVQPAVDFSLAPDLSRQLVTDDPPAQNGKRPSFDPAAASPYTGPSVGTVPNGRGATIGYRWSTD